MLLPADGDVHASMAAVLSGMMHSANVVGVDSAVVVVSAVVSSLLVSFEQPVRSRSRGLKKSVILVCRL